jgi:hypothetical protein
MNNWHHDLWLAVPLVALIFAPLQAVAMIMGVITRSGTAALLVAILFAGTVWAFQESAAAPDIPPAAIGDKDRIPVTPETQNATPPQTALANGGGNSDAITSDIIQFTSTVLPPARNSILWLERFACPRPQVAYRDLFQRIRYGHRGIGAAAARVIAAASAIDPEEKKQEEALAFSPLLISTLGFTVVAMAISAWLLKRRDL